MKNFEQLKNSLKDSVKTNARNSVLEMKKSGSQKSEILKEIKRKYSSLSDMEILSMMEGVTGIPVTGNIVPVNEQKGFDCEDYIFVPDSEEGKKYYIEGTVSFKELSLLEKEKDIRLKKKCELCLSREHGAEDCTNIQELCKTYGKRVARYCSHIKEVINPEFSNTQVLEFIVSMNEAKEQRNEKSFEFDGKKYSIKEQTDLLKDYLEDGSDKEVYGYIKGRLYQVKNSEYPKNIQYIKVSNFNKG